MYRRMPEEKTHRSESQWSRVTEEPKPTQMREPVRPSNTSKRPSQLQDEDMEDLPDKKLKTKI